MGVVQGLLEWIPVSSEGQLLVIAIEIYNISPESALSLAIWLHFGTLFAVLLKYKTEWLKLINLKDESVADLRSLVIYATLGTAMVALPLRLLINDIIDNSTIKSVILLVIGIALIFTGGLMMKSKEIIGSKVIGDLSVKQKLLIGMSQGLSIIPGISRSGTTIGAFLLLKINKEDSFKASFIISVPAVLGAVGVDIMILIFEGNGTSTELSIYGIIISIFFAFIIGYVTIEAILAIVKNYDFSVITIIIGIILLGVSLFSK